MTDTIIEVLFLGKWRTNAQQSLECSGKVLKESRSLPSNESTVYKGISLYLLVYINENIPLMNYRKFRIVCI